MADVNDVFLKLVKSDGSTLVKGEALDAVFKDMIEIDTFNLEADRDLSGEKDRLAESLKFLPRLQALTTNDSMLGNIGAMFNDEEAASVSEQGGLTSFGKATDSFSIQVTKEMDLASADLFMNYCTTSTREPAPYGTATFYFRKAGVQTSSDSPPQPEDVSFLVLEFSKPYVYKYSLRTQGEESSLSKESVSFYFTNYQATYRAQDATGALSTDPIIKGWNLAQDNDQFS